MLKLLSLASAAMLFTAATALSATNVDVRVNAPAPPGVNVQVGAPPLPQPRIVERERIIVKEKSDRGKHKGHYKHKKQKKHNKH